MSRSEGTRSDAAPPPSGDHTYAAGDRCEKYRIVKLLGEGGMGQVYVAEDDYLGRRVALKVVRRKYTQGGSFAQGQRKEARVLAELDHPNIVKVHDAGITRGGVMYIVMELIDGISLRELIRRLGALDLPSALSIAAQIADAVRVAHRAGIVHRDLKPENALVTRAGMVKVVDFGIAKRIRRRAEGQASSDPFANIGTVHYMAPEQALGDGATKASDVYAIGMILYEMIAGRHTFAAASHELPTRGEVILHQVHAVPRRLLEAVPGFDAPEISDLVDRMLSKIPRDRPRAAEVQRALSREVRRRREEHPHEEARFSLAPEHRRDAPIAPQPRGGRASLAALVTGAAPRAGDGAESGGERAAWPGSDEAPPGPQHGTAPLDDAFRPPAAALPFRPTGAAPPVLRGRGWTMRMHGAPGGPGVPPPEGATTAGAAAPPEATTTAGAAAPPSAGSWLPSAGAPPSPGQVTAPWVQRAAAQPATAPLPGPPRYHPGSAPGPATQAGMTTSPSGGSAGARGSTAPWPAVPAGPIAPVPAALDPRASAAFQPVAFGPPPSTAPPGMGLGLPPGAAPRPGGLDPRPLGRHVRAGQWLAVSVASLLTSGFVAAAVIAWWLSRDPAAPDAAAPDPAAARGETADPPDAGAHVHLAAVATATAPAAGSATASAAGSATASAAPISAAGAPEEVAAPPTGKPALDQTPSPAAMAPAASAGARVPVAAHPGATPAPAGRAAPASSPASPARPARPAASAPRSAATAGPRPRATATSGSPWDMPNFTHEDDDIYGMPAPDRRRAAPAPPVRKAPSRPF
ncbi:protein kinase [Sorangium sp. So ce269]